MYIYECHRIPRMTGELLWQQLNIVVSAAFPLQFFFLKDLKLVSVTVWVDATYMTSILFSYVWHVGVSVMFCYWDINCKSIPKYANILEEKYFDVRMSEGMKVLWLRYS